jgi:predicted porin
MKKLLVALLATAGITSAYAQSSVSIYGILDVGYIGSSSEGAVGNKVSKTTNNTFGNNAEQTSRLGFRGTEDLGGGRSAFFTVETGLTPSQGQTSTWDNRQSFVGIKQNGIGQVAVGTQYTPIHTAVAATDAGQQNNMVGDVIYATGAASGTSGNGSNSAYTIRTANTLSVKSDNFKGFSAGGFATLANSNTTQTNATGGSTNYNGYGLTADYTWNKLYVVAAYQTLKSEQTTSFTAPTYWTTNASSSAPGGGVNTQDTQKYVGATYNFGILKAYAQYVARKATSTVNSNDYLSRTAQQVGVRGNITSTIDAWASVGNGRYDAFGANTPTVNFNAFQIGSNYWLSKRTNLYAIYGQNKTSSTNVATLAPALAASNYAVGVRHTF